MSSVQGSSVLEKSLWLSILTRYTDFRLNNPVSLLRGPLLKSLQVLVVIPSLKQLLKSVTLILVTIVLKHIMRVRIQRNIHDKMSSEYVNFVLNT